jgi:hypothetical protein
LVVEKQSLVYGIETHLLIKFFNFMEENKKDKKLVVIIGVLLLLLLGILYWIFFRRPLPKDENNLVKDQTPLVQSGVYEDDVIKMKILPGWQYKNLSRPEVGVELSKDKYVMTVITNFKQNAASEGGVFSDISSRVIPWINPGEAQQCFGVLSNESREVGKFKINNLYFAPGSAEIDTKIACGNPTIGGVLWYGSYFNQGSGFLFHQATAETSIVITLKYQTNSANNAPYKGDSALQRVVDETSTMVKGIEFKTSSSTVSGSAE